MFLTWLLMWKKEERRWVKTKVFKTENTDHRKQEVEYIGLEKGSFILSQLTWLHRDTWKMFPSLPPQNRKYSQGSEVTDIISTSNRTDSSSWPEDNSHTWARIQETAWNTDRKCRIHDVCLCHWWFGGYLKDWQSPAQSLALAVSSSASHWWG